MIEVAKTQLAAEDQIVKSYRAIRDRAEGFLVFSNHKLMFIAEKGLFRKKFQVFLEVDYDEVASVSIQASHRLEVTEKNGLTHAFTSFGNVTADLIKTDTQKLIARQK
jgi:hypothetical protein